MARHHARELALKVLFEHDLAHTAIEDLLTRTLDGESGDDQQYARTLVAGTLGHLGEVDPLVGQAAIDWRLHRMPTIDRNIIRLATFEMLHEPEVPLSVIINEALELTQAYSTVEAKRFVNGVLGKVAEEVRPEGDQDRPQV